MAKPSTAEIETYRDAITTAYPKMRQLAAARKKTRDQEKTMYAALSQAGVTKEHFKEAWKRHEKDDGQLTLFDQIASACEDVMREIASESGPKAEDDREEAHKGNGKAKTKAAAKKGAKKAGAKEPEPAKPKRADAASPENLPSAAPATGTVARPSFRKGPNGSGRGLH